MELHYVVRLSLFDQLETEPFIQPTGWIDLQDLESRREAPNTCRVHDVLDPLGTNAASFPRWHDFDEPDEHAARGLLDRKHTNILATADDDPLLHRIETRTKSRQLVRVIPAPGLVDIRLHRLFIQ